MSADPGADHGWVTPPPRGRRRGPLFWLVMGITAAVFVLGVAGCVAAMLAYG